MHQDATLMQAGARREVALLPDATLLHADTSLVPKWRRKMRRHNMAQGIRARNNGLYSNVQPRKGAQEDQSAILDFATPPY